MKFFYLKNDDRLFLCRYNKLTRKFFNEGIMAEEKNSFTSYSKKLSDALTTVNQDLLNKLFHEILNRVETDKKILILGNGGSLANAEHISGDYLKTLAVNKKKLNISSPGGNSCYLTAMTNDLSYEDSYAILVNSQLGDGDLIIYLSGSGNSMNLVKCARKAKSKVITQVSLTAYSGGALSEIVDIPIVVKVDDMEIAEDSQLIIFHYLKQKLLNRLVKIDNKEIMPKYLKRTINDLVS